MLKNLKTAPLEKRYNEELKKRQCMKNNLDILKENNISIEEEMKFLTKEFDKLIEKNPFFYERMEVYQAKRSFIKRNKWIFYYEHPFGIENLEQQQKINIKALLLLYNTFPREKLVPLKVLPLIHPIELAKRINTLIAIERQNILEEDKKKEALIRKHYKIEYRYHKNALSIDYPTPPPFSYPIIYDDIRIPLPKEVNNNDVNFCINRYYQIHKNDNETQLEKIERLMGLKGNMQNQFVNIFKNFIERN